MDNNVSDSGHLDGFIDSCIAGWAYDGSGSFCSVDIIIDGLLIGTVLADQFRQDLKEAGVGSGCCAFQFRIPEGYLTGGKQRLSVRLSGTGTELIGSPIDIVGAGAGAGGVPVALTSELLVNPALKNAGAPFGVMVAGANPIAPGVWVEASRSAIGSSAFGCGIFDGFPFSQLGSMAPGLRLQVPMPKAHLRLFFEMRVPRFVVVSPLTLSFALDRREAADPLSLKVGMACLVNGAPAPVWMHTPKRLLPGMQELSLTIDPVRINELRQRSAQRGAMPVLYFELFGPADVALSAVTIRLGRVPPDSPGEPLREFEDPNLREQWEEAGTGARRPPATARHDREWAHRDLLDVPEIILPVFNAPKAVADCLASIRDNTRMPHLLTIVDDGSFADTAALIDRFASSNPWCRLLAAAGNEGYTVAVNKAIKSSAGRAVVVLNSDTIVTPGWLSGLLECLDASPDTGVAGPLSNAATWQSLPEVKRDGDWVVNELPPGMTPESSADLLRSVSTASFPEVPVVNGFCIAVKRKVFDTIGLFDELNFPIGYGEENDFCLRAGDAGFKLRIADHVYVYHAKSKSFGDQRRRELSERAGQLLAARYGVDRLRLLGETMARCEPLNEIRRKFALALNTPVPESHQ